MTEEQRERFFDLLTTKAIYGLNDAEQAELDSLDPGTANDELLTLEMTAAAISLIDLTEEAMPTDLASRIKASAEAHFDAVEEENSAPQPIYGTETVRPVGSGWFAWLGWAAAAAACIALAVNIYIDRSQPAEIAKVTTPPVQTPRPLTPAEQREQLLNSQSRLITASWSTGNVKDLSSVSGDIVWSDEKQAGYMRFRGLPANDKNKETYQLWIFDKTQDKATPIDGGTFDVSSDGEVVIPINAKLRAVEPSLFAVTIEKPGGVVVSKREKIAALATVETKTNKAA